VLRYSVVVFLFAGARQGQTGDGYRRQDILLCTAGQAYRRLGARVRAMLWRLSNGVPVAGIMFGVVV